MERTIFLLIDKKVAYTYTTFLLLTFCLCLINVNSFSQEKKLKIYPTAGITWRSTAMNFFNFKAVIPKDGTIPYHSEKNVQGFSLNTGVLIQFNNLGFEYFPNFRYDVITGKVWIEDEYIKDFIIDHNFNLILKRKIEYGIGFSIINSRKGYYFVNPVLRYHNIEFKTYNLFVTVPIKKVINLEIKALYVPKGFPYNPNEKYIMYSLRAYYRFNFLNKLKSKSQ